MGRVYDGIEVGLEESIERKIARLAGPNRSFRILRQSIDARHRRPHWVYRVEVFDPGEQPAARKFDLPPLKNAPAQHAPPIIVGAGPAGLFAALRLVERGIPCLLLEQGAEANARMRSIVRFWRYGELDAKSNVCFGEGGAGLYSDGKLITRIRSPHIAYVLHQLVQFGAPPEVEYAANPHVGSDRIRRLIPPMREYIRARGGTVRFNTKVRELWIENAKVRGVVLDDGSRLESEHVVLATGHSATDLLYRLQEQGVFVEGKSFALGLRIEHPQAEINRIQYGAYAEHPSLGAANYRLADHDHRSGIGVYSFCMCPGGYVISSGTDGDKLVANGMSNFARNSPFANSGIVVSVDQKSWDPKEVFGGMKLRDSIEHAAFRAVQDAGGTRQLPAQRLVDFLSGEKGPVLPTSSPSGVVPARLDQILPDELSARLREGLVQFQRRMPGFVSENAQLHGVESRTSCPVRVTRHAETFESLTIAGLYPSGEGAGYAGGITSAAVDGVRVAEAIAVSMGAEREDRF